MTGARSGVLVIAGVLLLCAVSGCKRQAREGAGGKGSGATTDAGAPEYHVLPVWATTRHVAPWRLVFAGDRLVMLRDDGLEVRALGTPSASFSLALEAPQGVAADGEGGVIVLDGRRGYCRLDASAVVFACQAAQVEVSPNGRLKRLFVVPGTRDVVATSIEGSGLDRYSVGAQGVVGPTRIATQGAPYAGVIEQRPGVLLYSLLDQIHRVDFDGHDTAISAVPGFEHMTAGPNDGSLWISDGGRIMLVKLDGSGETVVESALTDAATRVFAMASTPTHLALLVEGPGESWSLQIYRPDGALVFTAPLARPGALDHIALAARDDQVAVAGIEHVGIWDWSGKVLFSTWPARE